jgi:hypothetical protein
LQSEPGSTAPHEKRPPPSAAWTGGIRTGVILRGTTKVGIVRACGVFVMPAMAAMARVGTGGNADGDD